MAARLLTVRESAAFLGTSESWVRRHVRELPAIRLGRLIRFDSALLLRQFQGKQSAGNRLKPERGKASGGISADTFTRPERR
jgi:excisionase family DNA binding protein